MNTLASELAALQARCTMLESVVAVLVASHPDLDSIGEFIRLRSAQVAQDGPQGAADGAERLLAILAEVALLRSPGGRA